MPSGFPFYDLGYVRLFARVAFAGQSGATSATQFIIPRSIDVAFAHPADTFANGALAIHESSHMNPLK